MTCPECGSEQLVFHVPPDLRGSLPEKAEFAAICTHCLAFDLVGDEPASETEDRPDFTSISDVFPVGETGVAMAIAVGLLDSLALYRTELMALLEQVERGGTDPLLVLDRLGADSGVEPHFDLDRRRTQAEQLLYG